jgi:exosortase E/protease (VPEID-CTERM system)
VNSDCVSTGVAKPQSARFFVLPRYLLGRLYLLGAIAALELAFCFGERATNAGHFRVFGLGTIAYGQIPVYGYVAFLVLGRSIWKAQREEIPFGRVLFCIHLLCIAAVLYITLVVQKGARWQLLDPSGYAKSAVYLLGTVLLAFACVPPRSWRGAIRATGLLWLYASLVGLAGWFVSSLIRLVWNAEGTYQSIRMQGITFQSVRAVLGIFRQDIVYDPASFTMSTSRIESTIAPGCTGIEGLGLILIFTSVSLWYFRRECRFPRALLLVPCALASIWLLNIARLCAFVLIGDAYGPEVAEIGFHARAGWIAFTIVALACSLVIQRFSWVRRAPAFDPSVAGHPLGGVLVIVPRAEEGRSEVRGESPAIRAYLVPFLAILAATFVSKAASGYFEWLYPLRFVVAVAAILYFWPELKKLDWRFGWFGPVAGVAIFLVWIAPTWLAHQFAASPIGPALAALSPTARWSWIAIRVAAAVVTVPIAEELAFRGYLARRFISREFDEVPFTGLTALSVGISSLVFGLMHGEHWLVGTLAGLAYAAALRWRGRMGDAVIAHAVSNLLLAAWVLGFGDWAQW